MVNVAPILGPLLYPHPLCQCRVYSHSLNLGWPCDLLWPQGWGRSGGVPAPSLGLYFLPGPGRHHEHKSRLAMVWSQPPANLPAASGHMHGHSHSQPGPAQNSRAILPTRRFLENASHCSVLRATEG